MSRTVFFAIPGDLDTPTGGYGYDRRLMAELPRLGWRVEHLRLPGAFPHPTDPDLAAVGAALGNLPNRSVVLVDGLAFGAMPAVVAEQAKRLRFVALVHHPLADETGLSSDDAQSLERSERAALACASRVICTSNATARRLTSGFGIEPARLVVAPPGTARQRQAPCQGDPAMILSVAAVVRRKGHDALVRALAALADRSWNCRIVGALDRDADWADSLRSLVAAHDLGDRVRFVGAVDDVDAEYQRADIFALPSRHEGYGMAFAEALAHGLPIGGFNAGAVPEVVPRDAGMLVDLDDESAYVEALGFLIDDLSARRRMAAAAWRAGQALPGWEQTAAIVAACLAEAPA